MCLGLRNARVCVVPWSRVLNCPETGLKPRPCIVAFMVLVSSGIADYPVWPSGEVGLEANVAECLAATPYACAGWHALRLGGATACSARKPDLNYYKWWGWWLSTAVALQYATRWTDPDVVAATVLPKFGAGKQVRPNQQYPRECHGVFATCTREGPLMTH